MTYAAVTHTADMTLGKLAKILSDGSVYPNLPNQSALWKKILAVTEGVAKGRQLNFEVLTSRGPASVQNLATGSRGTFARPVAAGVTEGTIYWKDFGVSLSYDLSLQDKTGTELMSYARPFALESESKFIQAARVMCAQAAGDGTGAIGIVSSASASTSTDLLTVVLDVATANADRSHPGWFDEGDYVKFASTAGVAHGTINNTGTNVTAWEVVSSDHDTATVVLRPLDSSYAAINISSSSLGATDPTAADVIYRIGITPNDLTAISTNDWNSISIAMAGLGALTKDDGSVVNGLTMSGTLAATRTSCDGNLVSPQYVRKVLSKLKRRTTGQSDGKQLTWKEALMHDITYDALSEQAEAGQGWYNVTELNTGLKKVGFQHQDTVTTFMVDPFIPFQRIYFLPDQKGPLAFFGSDFQQVKVGGVSEFLMPSSTAGTYDRAGMMFMQGSGALMQRHAAALGVVEDFITTT